jgi:radical SAM superfamily enzyme YgiQ (UPF0313 family)
MLIFTYSINSYILKSNVFFITPPFTQLNTPYPATAYLKGFLNTQEINSYQCDLGIEVILKLFSKNGIEKLFATIEKNNIEKSFNSKRIIALKKEYIKSIDAVISFLQDKNPTLAHLICERNFLPEANRFQNLDDLDWAFGTMGIRDKARHLSTLFLEDLSDIIIEQVDPLFGFSRYAERLGRSASTFNELNRALNEPLTFIDEILIEILEEKLNIHQPNLVAISAPFPGNLYSAFRCAQFIKSKFKSIKIAFGGGFANTELRSLSETKVFEYFDFITLDDGEAPILNLIEHIEGIRPLEKLRRTFTLVNNQVQYINNSETKDFSQKDVGTPDYSDFNLNDYLSVIEIANPMHRLWSDGRWNKLTLAHGCYWGKCTFCDISLDYIKVYEATTAKVIVDRIETIIQQTGNIGFHFVDEAAPPAMMKEVALEIIRRNINVVWWTNIRFEKSFSQDLCKLLAFSGCIAVSGGLEVASDRLLKLIDKGVTVDQVAKVADNFTQTGIMVHAYLMYGFPTQTAQETIDSLEIVRQLVGNEIIQSGYWHQFAMTAHSPVGLNPEKFSVSSKTLEVGSFANNDLEHEDRIGCNHELFSDGLKKSLFNYMHGIGFELPLSNWFDFATPKTTIHPDYILDVLEKSPALVLKDTSKLVWLENIPEISFYEVKKKGKVNKMAKLNCSTKKENIAVKVNEKLGRWLISILNKIQLNNHVSYTFQTFEKEFNDANLGNFEQFIQSESFGLLRESGMLIL